MVDSIGNEEWVLPYGINDTLFGTAKNTIELNNGEFLSTGSDWAASNYIQPLFMKFDDSGNDNSYISYTPDHFDENIVEGAFTEILQIDSSYFVQGVLEFQPGEVYKTCTYNIDTGLFSSEIQINNSLYLEDYGNYNLRKTYDHKILHTSTYNEASDQQIRFSKLNLNLEYDTAYLGLYNYDSLCIPGPPQSGIISLDTCDIITGIEIPTPSEYFSSLNTIPIKAYPNPVKDNQLTLSFQNTEFHNKMELRCFDIFGKMVHSEKVYPFQGESILDIDSWSPGMYFVIIYAEGKAVGECKFIVL